MVHLPLMRRRRHGICFAMPASSHKEQHGLRAVPGDLMLQVSAAGKRRSALESNVSREKVTSHARSFGVPMDVRVSYRENNIGSLSVSYTSSRMHLIVYLIQWSAEASSDSETNR